MKTKLKLILPLFAVAQIFSAPKKFPPRTPNQILLASCAKGVEVCKNCNFDVNCNESNVSTIVASLANSADMFQGSDNINNPNILRQLSPNESEIAIMGFIMLLADKTTGISLNEAIRAAEEFAKMSSSPQYFKDFVNNHFVILKTTNDPYKIVEILKNAMKQLDSKLVAKLEAAGNNPKYQNDDPLSPVRALLRNNKK